MSVYYRIYCEAHDETIPCAARNGSGYWPMYAQAKLPEFLIAHAGCNLIVYDEDHEKYDAAARNWGDEIPEPQ